MHVSHAHAHRPAAHTQGYNPDDANAVRPSALFFLYLGLVGLLAFVAIERVRKWMSDDALMLWGFGLTAVGCAILAIGAGQVGSGRGLTVLIIGELLVWSIGAPITGSVVLGSFSKTMGSKKQVMCFAVLPASI